MLVRGVLKHDVGSDITVEWESEERAVLDELHRVGVGGASSRDSSSIRGGLGVSLSESPKSISDSSFLSLDSFSAFPAVDELLRVLVFELERVIPVAFP